MSNLGPIYEDDENYSPARANAKGITRDTGTNIVALATTKQLGLVIPTDTSAGLVKNVTYLVDYDSSFNRIQFLPIFHNHIHSEGAQEGGRYLDIRVDEDNLRGYGEFIFNNSAIDPPDNFWWFTNTGATMTTTETTDERYHRINTGTTTGNYGTGEASSISWEWDDEIACQMIFDMDKNANILARIGVGIDRVQDTPSTTRRQMALEGCDGHGTNWVLLNANGNSGSLVVTATTAPLSSGVRKGYIMWHYPADSVQLVYQGNLIATSTTNVADDGKSNTKRMFRWGVKLAAGTSAINLDMYYVRVLGNFDSFP